MPPHSTSSGIGIALLFFDMRKKPEALAATESA